MGAAIAIAAVSSKGVKSTELWQEQQSNQLASGETSLRRE